MERWTTVQDDGTGVTEAERIRMPSRFANGGLSPGSGLGLAIVAAVMERGDGRSHRATDNSGEANGNSWLDLPLGDCLGSDRHWSSADSAAYDQATGA
ncbi:MAG: hypothetical protein WCL10_19975 [Novosphingobium sp.]|uniref:hypothetical protein n=1 Tax=Novosphingobium sp. TaxID=1874826 RepID=UPI0030160928